MEPVKAPASAAAIVTLLVSQLALPAALLSQMMGGRLLEERHPSGESLFHGGILVFASLEGPLAEARPFRTWETDPAGWYRISGSAGRYTFLFIDPARFLRPVVLTNVFLGPGERVERDVVPHHDHAIYFEGAWDRKPAREYDQLFVARGTSVTSVGFKLAHDGVDGFGPGAQDLVVSIHRRGSGTPDTWERVGAEMPVPGVDCGGGKSAAFSAGWSSGEVPVSPGATYAVRLRAATPGGAFQAFWRPVEGKMEDCFRVGADGDRGFQGQGLWLAVGADSDGLLIPYQKRVHRQFVEFAGFRSRWAQTYRAEGRSLAAAVLYAAVGGSQPPLSRQRAAVRVRRGGPGGPVVGIEKIAIGNGNYTGDASWGAFGAAFAPGEVPLTPGETYALEFESLETRETLRGFVNIKGQVSDERPGFNPYRKCPPDTEPEGTAYAGGTEAMDFDLDLQVLEYREAGEGWAEAVDPRDLLREDWKEFAIDPRTVRIPRVDGEGTGRLLRVTVGGEDPRTADGGFVQRVAALDRFDTYRLACGVRSTWTADEEHRSSVGYDPTGQTEDPQAVSIRWTVLPPVHGVLVPFRSPPIRPAEKAISIWLRGRCTAKGDPQLPFRADFCDLALRRVETGAPGPAGTGR